MVIKTYRPINPLLKSGYLFLLLSLLFFFVAYFIETTYLLQTKTSIKTTKVQDVLHKKENKLRNILKTVLQEEKSGNITKHLEKYNNLYAEEGMLFFVYTHQILCYWSSNVVPEYSNNTVDMPKVVHLQNGWYEVMEESNEKNRAIGLILIKTDYPYQNKYLINEFQRDFKLPNDVQIAFHKDPISHSIASDGKELFYLKYQNTYLKNEWGNRVVVLFNLLAIVFLILFLKKIAFTLSKRFGNNRTPIAFCIVLFALRWISIYIRFPSSFYTLSLFSPNIYATSFLFSSLGDFFINTILILYCVYYLHQHFRFYDYKVNKLKMFIAFILLLLVFLFSDIIITLTIGLIENSNISFNVNNFFELNVYSYMGLSIIGMLFFSFFLFTEKIIQYVKTFLFPPNQIFLLFYFSFILFLLYSLIKSNDFEFFLLPLIIPLLIYKFKQKSGNSLVNTVILLFIFSLSASYIILNYSTIKENKERQILAEKLSHNDDPITEFLYKGVEKKLLSDSLLWINNSVDFNKDNVEKQLVQKFFSSYFAKYEIHIHPFFHDSTLSAMRSLHPSLYSLPYFEQLIENKGEQRISKQFYYINNAEKEPSYIIVLPLLDKKNKMRIGSMYVTLVQLLRTEKIGFPELLLDREIQWYKNIENYAYAKYMNHQLVNQLGDYPYSLSLYEFDSLNTSLFFDKEGFSHLYYPVNNNSFVLLSKANAGGLEKATTFSYLFAFFSLLLLLFLFLHYLPLGFYFTKININNKIQLLLVIVLLFSLILFGTGTSYYIKQNYNDLNYKNISEKILSVLIEVEHKFEKEKTLSNTQKEYLNNLLSKFSKVFFTDINLYDIEGNLLATSRPELFDKGLVSKKMNIIAYNEMTLKQKSEFIHDERIGKLNYLSAYLPFKNEKGELLAYLNLPYFAKQDEFAKEISSFLVALVNIYVLLLALSVVAALLISNIITKPLRFIQTKLSQIELGKSNKPIEYEGKDEIGRLVNIYNQKVEELQKNVELLAKSEREIAWREMAKQVAHEIKNPLTPMKLNVQHLERAWKDKAPDWDNRLKHFTLSMIEQIDTLSAIASEFSHFAQMPKANFDKVNIVQILQSVIKLYKDTPNITFLFASSFEEEKYVFADKDQLMRVFSNLVKNAIQAIPLDKQGIIDIKIRATTNFITAEIKDNGIGIPLEEKDKIFIPSFTSKTGGMGLGLAIVKDVVDNINGKIWFDTKINAGTSFYVKLPEYVPS